MTCKQGKCTKLIQKNKRVQTIDLSYLGSINKVLLWRHSSLPKNFNQPTGLPYGFLFDKKIERPYLCLIFNSKKMKKAVTIACILIACIQLTSCTAEPVESTQTNASNEVVAGGGDQNAETPTKKPQ